MSFQSPKNDCYNVNFKKNTESIFPARAQDEKVLIQFCSTLCVFSLGTRSYSSHLINKTHLYLYIGLLCCCAHKLINPNIQLWRGIQGCNLITKGCAAVLGMAVCLVSNSPVEGLFQIMDRILILVVLETKVHIVYPLS